MAPRHVQTAAGTAGSTCAHRDVVFDGQASKGVHFADLCSSRERWGYLGRPGTATHTQDAEAAERHAHLVVDVPVPGPLLQLWVCSGCAGLACWVSEGPRALRGGPILFAQRWELPARAGGSYLRHDQDRHQDKSTGHLPGSWIALCWNHCLGLLQEFAAFCVCMCRDSTACLVQQTNMLSNAHSMVGPGHLARCRGLATQGLAPNALQLGTQKTCPQPTKP